MPVNSGVEVDLINESRELQLQYERTDGVPPIFIKLLEAPFENWIISIEDIKILEDAPETKYEEEKANFSFGYNICRVPKEINDNHIQQHKGQLNILICEVFNDIIEVAFKEDQVAITEENPEPDTPQE